MPKLRLGVALLIPPPLVHEVDALRKALGDIGLGRIPAHLTLVPPANVPAERWDDALRLLAAAADSTDPFTVRLGPPQSFLPVSPTLYLPVDEGTRVPIDALRTLVLRGPLERPLTWPFVPHVTIGDEIPHARIEAAVAALEAYSAEVTFRSVHLLQGTGRVWGPVAEAPFRS